MASSMQDATLAVAGPTASELAEVLRKEEQRVLDRRKEAGRRVIHGRKDHGQDRDPVMKLLAKPSWEKEELPQSVTLRDGTQQDLLQVTPVLALRPRDRGGSRDTWRNRSRPSRESSGRPGRDQGSRVIPAPDGGGAGLEKAWRLADEGAYGPLANRGLRGAGPGVLEGEREMTPGPL